MKKKSLQVILSLILVLTMITGCGGSAESETSKDAAPAATEKAAEAKAEEGGSDAGSAEGEELVIWMPPFAGSDAAVTDQEFWTQQLQPLIEETGVSISIEVVPWDSYETKYLTGVSSGEGPDIGYLYMEMFSDYINMGAIAEIDSYFTDAEKDNYYYYNQGNFGGVQYALPIIVGNPRIFVANMDILNAAGVDAVPDTLEGVVEVSKKIQAYDADVKPFTQAWGDAHFGVLNENFWPIFWAMGGSITDENGEPNLNTEAGVAAAQYIYDLRFKDGVLPEDVTSVDSGDIRPMMEAGELAMAVVSASQAKKLGDAGVNWDFVTAQAGPAGDAGTFVAADCLVMFESAENKELAAQAMKLMTSAPVMEAFHEGLYNAPPISKDEAYKDLEAFKPMYENESDKLIALPVFQGATTFYDALYKNIQNMMLDDMTPEEVMEDTMNYYESSIKE